MKVRVLDDFERLANSFYATSQLSHTPIDLYRRDDHYVAEFDLPGIDPSTIDISVENGTLTVSARRDLQRSSKDAFIVAERSTGQYQRTLHLGQQLDVNGIAAEYVHGVLTVTIPLAENAKQRKIPVNVVTAETNISTAS
jgi:HSP20 family protein